MPLYTEKPTIISMEVDVRPDTKMAFADWQANLNAKIARVPGFVSLEFLSPNEQHKQWLIVERFSSAENAHSWHESLSRKELLEKLKTLTYENGIHETSADEASIKAGVTEVIVAEVNPEKEQAFRSWSAKIHQAEAKFPGFRGVYLQSPEEARGRHWITLLQFDTIENLDRWLQSSEREALLNESKPLINFLETHRVISPYAGWFASIAKVGEIPPVWKQTMIVLLVLFPIVMFELKYLNPQLTSLNHSVATFIGNAISVTLISFPMMPIAIWFLGWWLSARRQLFTIIGTGIVLALYLIEIILLWNFL